MKQYHVETKNQGTGEWRLYQRFKCHYRLGYATSRFAVINEADAELEAVCRAVIEANHVRAVIETRIVEVEFTMRFGCNGPLRQIIWENGAFGQKVRTNGAHTV